MVQLIKKNSFVIILLSLSYLFIFILINQPEQPIESEYVYVMIEDGDTLWTVADRYVDNDRLSHEGFIEWTETTNGITRNNLVAGSMIAIPVKVNDIQSQSLASAE